ncbi:MAG: rhodanese-like domain-containing protein [Candidatus Dormiibacterota bacterium]
MALQVSVLQTPELGDRSYLVGDGRMAAAIDPQRDIDRVLDILGVRGWTLGLVLETHLHNDYVTGGLELAMRTGARYVVAGGEEATYDCTPAREGDRHRLGELEFQVVGTPGHTVGHAAYVLADGHRERAVFTGGSMLFGTVGRTDLVSPELTDSLSRRQHASVRRLARELGGEVEVHPTHGFGSFCASTPGSGSASSTIDQEARLNLACQIDDEDRFVEVLRAGLGAYPAYYSHMGLLNRAGPAPLDLSPSPSVEPALVRSRAAAGEWVVDLRPRREYAARHLPGSIGVELSPDYFTTYLGWVLPWGMPITLMGESREEVRRAQRQLARIGIDRPAGEAVAPEVLDASSSSYPVADFAELARLIRSGHRPDLVDVRSPEEWAGRRIPGAINLPLGDLQSREGSLPAGPLWVHCQAGYRASIGASLLARSGHQVVLVDDDFSSAERVGIATGPEALPQRL